MKERFEFIDGSFYEFERWSKEDLVQLGIVPTHYWYIQLVADEEVKKVEAEGKWLTGEKLYFVVNPSVTEQFRVDYNRFWGRARAPKKAKDLASDVFTVGLTYNGKTVTKIEDAPHDMYQGVYLPVRYSSYVFGNLHIDPNSIVSKVLYEPSIVPNGFRKLLTSKHL